MTISDRQRTRREPTDATYEGGSREEGRRRGRTSNLRCLVQAQQLSVHLPSSRLASILGPQEKRLRVSGQQKQEGTGQRWSSGSNLEQRMHAEQEGCMR